MKETIYKLMGVVTVIIGGLLVIGSVTMLFEQLTGGYGEVIGLLFFFFLAICGGSMITYVVLTFRYIGATDEVFNEDILDEFEI